MHRHFNTNILDQEGLRVEPHETLEALKPENNILKLF